MPRNQQFDSIHYDSIAFPYNRVERELSDNPRFFRGLNMYINYGGKIAKRPGTQALAKGSFNSRVDRLWLYETLETPPKVYLIASVFNSATSRWELWYQRLSSSPSDWTIFNSIRDCNQSTLPHEAVAARGLFYIKSFPASTSTEKLGSLIFDGSGAAPSYKFWGLLGPTEPARLGGNSKITKLSSAVTAVATTFNVDSTTGFPAAPFAAQIEFEQVTVTAVAPTSFTVTRGAGGTTAAEHPAGTPVVFRDFAASTHPVTVGIYWGYSYAYKSITGHVSDRAPTETNPDKLPSYTGPFENLIPKLSITGHPDTVNIPTIQVYRTTDGGGTWYLLEEIANTGGTITYLDDSLESGSAGGSFNDPIPDSLLNTFNPAPGIDTNSPPPTTLAPEITGVATPKPTTPLAYYSGRIWFAIGNVLFYSAQEELTDGIPEEAFPAGLDGNFFRIQYPITNVIPTANALYVCTLQGIYQITGTNRETLTARPVLENIGHPYGHPRAITRFTDKIALLTHDYRVAMIQDSDVVTLSDPLFTDIVDAISAGAEMDIKYWADLNNEWLIVTALRQGNTNDTRQWVLDLKRTTSSGTPFWFVPWTIRATAVASGRISELTGQRRLIFFVWDNETSNGYFVRLDPTGRVASDYFPGGEIGITWYFDTHQMQNPPGNHVNNLRVPALTTTVTHLVYDRTNFVGDEEPQTYYYLDDLWNRPINVVSITNPPRREPSIGYTTVQCNITSPNGLSNGAACQRFAFRMYGDNTFSNFELQDFYVVFNPEGGA